MSIFLNDNFSTEFPKPLDNRYGPFDDVASALAFLEPYKRYIGLTVGIGTSTIIEYWFDGGILDANFIVKSDHSIVDWGDIGGTLSNQTDLQTALNLKLDASIVSGGLTGQILAKDSNADYDVSWIDNYTEDIRDTVKATEPINKGQAVYISGANGTNQLATKADYSGEQTSSQTIGLAYQNFVTNQIGQIITQGLLTGIDTSGANAAGDPVYLGANGNLIYGYANKPKAPYHLVYIGIVTRKNASNGEIYVKIQNGYELEELHNVAITSPTNNQGIFYNSTNGLWENKSIITALGYTPVSESGSYSNPSWLTALAWGKITSTPTTIAGYGITDGVSTGGSYANPTWLTSLAWGKITSTPTTLSGYGITDGVSTSGSYSNPSWITDLAFSKITGYSVPTLAQVTTAGNTTTNAITVGVINGTTTVAGNMINLQSANSTSFSVTSNLSPYPSGSIILNMQVNPSASGSQGAYMNFTGAYESFLNVISTNAIAGNKYWRIGNIGASNYFVIQKLNDSATTISLNAMTISSSTGNISINTTTDAGFKFDVNGTARIQNQLTTTGTITAASAIARGVYFNQTLTAAANNDVLVGLDINPTFTTGAFTGVNRMAQRITVADTSANAQRIYMPASSTANIIEYYSNNSLVGRVTSSGNFSSNTYFNLGGENKINMAVSMQIQLNNIAYMQMFQSTGNMVLQNGGTYTDAGYRLDVNGTVRIQNVLTLGSLSADPTGANGMIYYNTTLGMFRVYQSGAWKTVTAV